MKTYDEKQNLINPAILMYHYFSPVIYKHGKNNNLQVFKNIKFLIIISSFSRLKLQIKERIKLIFLENDDSIPFE